MLNLGGKKKERILFTYIEIPKRRKNTKALTLPSIIQIFKVDFVTATQTIVSNFKQYSNSCLFWIKRKQTLLSISFIIIHLLFLYNSIFMTQHPFNLEG